MVIPDRHIGQVLLCETRFDQITLHQGDHSARIGMVLGMDHGDRENDQKQ